MTRICYEPQWSYGRVAKPLSAKLSWLDSEDKRNPTMDNNHSSIPVHQSSYQPGGYQPGGYAPGSGPGGYQYPGQQPWAAPTQLAGLGGRIVAFLIDRFLVGIFLGVGYVLMIVIALAGAATQTDEGATLIST